MMSAGVSNASESPPSRTILILYGSETGNSQEIAEDLDKCVQRLHFESRLAEMDSVQLSTLLQYSLVVFVIGTTGQGDVPRNATLLWKKLLRRKLTHGCLAAVKFTTFGLGDSSYPKFNWAARKLVRRLEQLGALEVFPSGEADERHSEGTDGLYLRWFAKLQEWLLSAYPISGDLKPLPEDVPLPPRFVLRWDSTETSKSSSLPDDRRSRGRSLPVVGGQLLTLVSNERITALDHFQDVRLLKFDLPNEKDGSKLELNPGDTITIFPRNTPEDAQKVIDFMAWGSIADTPIDWSKCEKPTTIYVDDTFTLRDLLIHNLDITAVPRRSFLRNISYFASNPDHRERLLEFTSPQFLDEYYDYTTRPRRTILEVLHEFDSVKVPPERALDTFPLIRGREFSIANAGDKLRHPTDPSLQRIELIVALVRYKTILRKERRGLCSRYLDTLAPGTTIPTLHKKSLTTLVGPAVDPKPLVAVATGTGIAPIRALLYHRNFQTPRAEEPKEGENFIVPPAAHLFFGFRNQKADFHFADDWPTFSFLTIHAAESRPAPPETETAPSSGPGTKAIRRKGTYVQDLVRKEACLVADMVRRDAVFLICGGSHKMAEAVKEAVLFAIETEMGIRESQERDKVFGRLNWVQEIW